MSAKDALTIPFNLRTPTLLQSMPIQNNTRTFVIMAILLVGVGATAVMAVQILNAPVQDPVILPSTLNVTLLTNAGVMIETNDTRIYIDPYLLNSTFAAYPADIILVTHPHGDHYDPTSLDIIETESTEFIFPSNMTTECATYGATGVEPGDTVMIGNINITAFYMYTLPVDIYPASHPAEANWTSFIITLENFTIFHSGDSKNIVEYYDLTDQIDLAFLPLGPGCQTMADYEVVQALARIEPTYFIPIHYGDGVQDSWIASYGDDVEDIDDCTAIVLEYWTMHTFELE
ncbi:MAG: MBL fold metallo-hydrolase [Candidatus Thorarchaeota archaeon]|nr:MAG: MBL fold metallo-hydrolase [Candidatus Thorarchaeota archaeon]